MDEDSEQQEFDFYDFIEGLNKFSFLRGAARITSIEDFCKKIDARTITNNLILICSQELTTEVLAKLEEKSKRMRNVKGMIIFDPKS